MNTSKFQYPHFTYDTYDMETYSASSTAQLIMH